jgi:hypothetical protein
MVFVFQATKYGAEEKKKVEQVAQRENDFIQKMTPSKGLTEIISATSIINFEKGVKDVLAARLEDPKVRAQTMGFLDFAKSYKPVELKA